MLTIVGGCTIYKLTFVLIRFLSEGVFYVSRKGRHGRRQFPQREDVGREAIQSLKLSMKLSMRSTLDWWAIHWWSACHLAFPWREHYNESTRSRFNIFFNDYSEFVVFNAVSKARDGLWSFLKSGSRWVWWSMRRRFFPRRFFFGLECLTINILLSTMNRKQASIYGENILK